MSKSRITKLLSKNKKKEKQEKDPIIKEVKQENKALQDPEVAEFIRKQNEASQQAEREKAEQIAKKQNELYKKKQDELVKEVLDAEREAQKANEIVKGTTNQPTVTRPSRINVKPRVYNPLNIEFTLDVGVKSPIDVEVNFDVMGPNVKEPKGKEKEQPEIGGAIEKGTQNTAEEITGNEEVGEIISLYLEAINGNRDVINDLDERLSRKDDEGNTLLHRFVLKGDLETVKLLLKAGAKYKIKNDGKKTPLELATNNEIIEILQKQETIGVLAIQYIEEILINQAEFNLNNVLDMNDLIKTIEKTIDSSDSKKTIQEIINQWIEEHKEKVNEIKSLKGCFIEVFPYLDMYPNDIVPGMKGKENKKQQTNVSVAIPYVSAGEDVITIINTNWVVAQRHADASKSKSDIADEIVETFSLADKKQVERDLAAFWPTRINFLIEAIKKPEPNDDIEEIFINWKQEHLTPKNDYQKAYYPHVEPSVEEFFDKLRREPGIQSQLKKKPNENKDAKPERIKSFNQSIQRFISDCKANGKDPLCEAINIRNLDYVNELLGNGYDPTVIGDTGQTALHLGVIRAGGAINKIKSEFPSAGKEVIEKETVFLAELLLKVKENKLDVNVQNKDGDTPLHLAVKLSPELVKPLLKAGADITFRNKKGETPVDLSRTPLQLAVINKDMDALKKLIIENVNVNERDLEGKTALNYALEIDYANRAIMSLMVSILLEAGADPTLKHKGKTPLDRELEKAKTVQNEFVIKMLREKEAQYDLAKKWENSAGKFVTEKIKARINNKTVTKDVETKMKNLCDIIEKRDPEDQTTMEDIITTWINENKTKSQDNKIKLQTAVQKLYKPKKVTPEEDFLKFLMATPEIKEQLQKSSFEPEKGISKRQQQLKRIGKTSGF